MAYVFGLNIPILELLVLFSIVVVAYLIILELEFRQLRKIIYEFDKEENVFNKEIKELAKEIKMLRESLKKR